MATTETGNGQQHLAANQVSPVQVTGAVILCTLLQLYKYIQWKHLPVSQNIKQKM